MEAAGAPRLDAERRELVRRSTRGAGQRGLARRDKSKPYVARLCRRGGRGAKRAPFGAAPSGDLRAVGRIQSSQPETGSVRSR